VVVGLAAAGLDRLTDDVVDHLARVGRLGKARLEVAARPRDLPGLGSAQEADHWRQAITVGEPTRDAVRDRWVLLVVDATSTLWPITVAAAKIREAGAAGVLPLLLHRRP
jgi:ATP-dependent DNA helicase RecQ